MTREEKYDKVNQCTTLEELAQLIETFADEEGLIQGRTRKFDANKMANFCREFTWVQPNVLTREFGIRQQAMHIMYYTKGFPVTSKSLGT